MMEVTKDEALDFRKDIPLNFTKDTLSQNFTKVPKDVLLKAAKYVP